MRHNNNKRPPLDDRVSASVLPHSPASTALHSRAMNVAKTDAGASAVPPWDDAAYPWDERPLPPVDRPLPPSMRLSKHDNNPTVVEIVFALKKWEVVATDGATQRVVRG